jgi:spore maturation protein CgeB
MRVVFFVHSLLSDWNHGNAHFLRGVCSELAKRGHRVQSYEPRDAWSPTSLVRDHGEAPLREVRDAYPLVDLVRYDPATIDLDDVLDGADLVVVHEWSPPGLVAAVGARRRGADFVLLFHDTHHRSVSRPAEMAEYDLEHYDGALVFGEVLREIYVREGFSREAWVWHEAADLDRFRPCSEAEPQGEIVWIGNWGDEERSRELQTFFVHPVRELGLVASAHGVRYPEHALGALDDAGIRYCGWLPNLRVPDVYARHLMTVHVPRRPYVEALPGIPTIRPFEALACGIPLVCAPWDDWEGLFTPGSDYLVANDGREMRRHLRDLAHDPALRRVLANHGRRTILARHTCAHRVDELLQLYGSLAPAKPQEAGAVA